MLALPFLNNPPIVIFQVGEYTSVASCGPVDLSEGALRATTPVSTTATTSGDVQIPILTELGQVRCQKKKVNDSFKLVHNERYSSLLL